MSKFIFKLLAIFLFAYHFSAYADFVAYHILDSKESPAIDGKLDDIIWKKAQIKDVFFTWSPRNGGFPPVKTEVQVAYDSSYLYFGLRAYDPQPNNINAPWVRRDKVFGDQDFIRVSIDSVGNGKFAQFFNVNAKGQVSDGLYDEDTFNEDYAPNFNINAAAHIDENGWTAELKIPFSELRYASGPQHWTLLVVRSFTRDQRYRLTTQPLVWGDGCMMCKKEALIGLESLPENLQGTVTVNAAAQYTRDSTDNQTDLQHTASIGLDFKVRVAPEWVLDGTLHPDALQVEMDSPQLTSNKQFALYYPEHRPFFLEGTDIWQSDWDPNDPQNSKIPIYTRSLTDLLWGARATYRDERLQGIVLSALDKGGGQILLPTPYTTNTANQPPSIVNLMRLRATEGSWVWGAFISNRDYDNGVQNLGSNSFFGPDFNWMINDQAHFRGHWFWSQTSAQPDAHGNLNNQPNQSGYAGRLEYIQHGDFSDSQIYTEQTSPNFRDDNGFYTQSGYRSNFVQLKGHLGSHGTLNEINLAITSQRILDWQDNLIKSSFRPGLWLSGPRETNLWIEPISNESIRVQPGGAEHNLRHVAGFIESLPPKWLNSIHFDFDIGEQVDVNNDRKTHGVTMSIDFKTRPTPRLEVDGLVLHQQLSNTSTGRNSSPDVSDWSGQMVGVFHVSATDLLRTTWQWGRTTRNVSAYTFPDSFSSLDKHHTIALMFIHAFNAQSHCYMGYTQGQQRSFLEPMHQTQNEFYIKQSWTYY